LNKYLFWGIQAGFYYENNEICLAERMKIKKGLDKLIERFGKLEINIS
jgi:hypothetical protein